MSVTLKISIGQHSDRGKKDINQDFHAVYIPDEPQLSSKGIAAALADGISSSSVSQIASETAVKSFLSDYYCTSDAWSVKKSALSVISATNSWLHAQTRRSQFRYEKDKGYVCTFSAIVLKSNTAHLFHIGDTRVYRIRNSDIEQLTEDHRLWISQQQSYLSRALGINTQLDLDYSVVALERGDVFILTTDGIYEFVGNKKLLEIIREKSDNLDLAASSIVDHAYKQGSDDNLTIQIIRVDEIPDKNVNEIVRQVHELPLPPQLSARMEFDGYKIVREIQITSRSHIFLATDKDSGDTVVIKTPSTDLRNDQIYLERMLMEEWIARRLDNAHILKSYVPKRKRNYLYIVNEFVEGQTLNQWLTDNPKPTLEIVRDIIEQIAKGLQVFHRKEMLHQDIRPNNIMIDKTGTVKIIDFGSTRVAGLLEQSDTVLTEDILGTAQYTAPEYFLGLGGTTRSDQFSLGVIAYQMLSGKLPYGAQVANCKTKAAQKKLRYRSLLEEDKGIPAWVDDAIKKAVHPDPLGRYEVLSEFIMDLRRPNKNFVNKNRTPLMERDPVLFWKSVSFILALITLALLINQQYHH